MKRIIIYIKNTLHINKISEFCVEEDYTLYNITSVDEKIEEDNILVLITDNIEFKPNLTNTPLCYITDSPSLGKCSKFTLKTTFNIINLRNLIDTIHHVSSINTYKLSYQILNFYKEYKINNDYYNIDKIICTLTAELLDILPFSSVEKLRIGISEMLTNAIEHGNLEITGDEKLEATEKGIYYELLDKRMQDEKLNKKNIILKIEYNNDRLEVTITDEGKGFDITSIPDPTDIDRLLALHGRGILITKMYFDNLEYNEKGNKVKLTKIFK